MESTTLKAENLKPIIRKAGFALAVSLVGAIYAWIMTKKCPSKGSSLSENKPDTPKTNISHHVEDEEPATPMGSSVPSGRLVIHDNPCLEQGISGLRSRIEGLQMRELALNLKFDRYRDMKEQKSLLMEIKNMLSLESARVESLDKEISSLEAENVRLENLVVQYLRVIEQLWRSENRVLQRKVQKLLRKSKAQSRLIKKQAMKIKAGEAEILRNHDALQTRVCHINNLEDEIKDRQGVLDQLQDEKNELLKKLDTAYASKVKAGDVSKEEYNKLLNELDQIKKKHAAKVKQCALEHHNNVPCFGSHAFSKWKRLLQRPKRWVECSEKVRVKRDGEKNHVRKCLGMLSVPHVAKETHVPARKSLL